MRVHHLKTDMDPLEQICRGHKTAEFRNNDRKFEVNDILVLHAYSREKQAYYDNVPTNATYLMISHVQDGYGIPEGYVMLSFRKLEITF